MAQRERRKVALQVVVAAHRAVVGDYQQLLVLRPAEALDRALVPLRSVSEPPLHVPYGGVVASAPTLMLRISLPAQL
jgi:hypothetical protein